MVLCSKWQSHEGKANSPNLIDAEIWHGSGYCTHTGYKTYFTTPTFCQAYEGEKDYQISYFIKLK